MCLNICKEEKKNNTAKVVSREFNKFIRVPKINFKKQLKSLIRSRMNEISVIKGHQALKNFWIDPIDFIVKSVFNGNKKE